MVINDGKGPTPLDVRKEAEAAIAKTPPLVEDLRRKTNLIPDVGPDGESECKVAEELYFQKQEAEENVIQHQSTLYTCLSDVGKQVARCKNNLVVISAGLTALQGEDPKRECTDAEVAQAAQYHHFVDLQYQLKQMIALVKAALTESQRKQYPGGARRPGPRVGPIDSTMGTEPLGDELEHLLTLDSAGRDEFASAVRAERGL